MSSFDSYLSAEKQQEDSSPFNKYVQQQEQEEKKASSTGRGLIADVAVSIGGGLRDAAQQAMHGLIDLSEFALEKSGAEALRSTLDPEGRTFGEAAEGLRKRFTLSEVQKSDTTVGVITRTITRFVSGFIGAGQLGVVKGAKAALGTSTAGRLAGAAVQGAVADFAVTDPHEDRLADLIESIPALENPVTEYLSSKDDDSRAGARFKSSLEGIVIGSLVDSVFIGVKAIRSARKLKAAGQPEAADEVLSKASKEAESALEKANSSMLDAETGLKRIEDLAAEAKAVADQVEFKPSSPKAAETAKLVDEVAAGRAAVDPAFSSLPAKGKPGLNLEVTADAPDQMVAVLRDENGNPLGALNFGVKETPTGRRVIDPDVELSTYVAPEHRRRGVASRLYEFAKTQGFDVDAVSGQGSLTPDGMKFVGGRAAKVEGKDAFITGVKKIARGEAPEDSLSGVLNYTKMDSPASVHETLSSMAKAVDSENLRGSYRSLAETKELAELLGTDSARLVTGLQSLAGESGKIDGYVVAGKTMVQSMSRDILDLATKIDNGLGGTLAEVELARRADILADVLENLSAVQTGAARATSAGRIRTSASIAPEQIASLLESAGGSEHVRALAQRIRMAGPNNTKGVVAAVRSMPSVGERALNLHNFIWINGLLSGVKTHLVNITSTGLNTLFMPAAKIVGGVFSKSPDAASRMVREGLYQYLALTQTVGDALSAAGKAFKTGQGVLDPGQGTIDAVLKMRGLTADVGEWNVKDALHIIASMPGRALGTADEFFKVLNYRSHLIARSTVDGMDNGLAGGSKELAEFVQDALQKSVDDAGRALDDRSLRMAREATFTQNLNDIDTWFGNAGAGLQKLVNQVPALRLILPFVRTPTNLARQLIDMTPATLVTRRFWKDVLGDGRGGAVDAEKRALAIGKAKLGSIMWYYATTLAMEGRITGGWPKDPDLRRQYEQAGWQPYSFVFTAEDGTKTYVSFARLDPFGTLFGLAADSSVLGELRASAHRDQPDRNIVITRIGRS